MLISEFFLKSVVNEVCRLVVGIVKLVIIVMLLVIDDWMMLSGSFGNNEGLYDVEFSW